MKREDLTKKQDGKSQLRVLVVEDEVKVARALREGLERDKYEVVVAPTGEEGFFLVNAEEFDLVLLDLMLPGRDGLQVLSTLRKRGLHTPVLILTALHYGQHAAKRQLVRAGTKKQCGVENDWEVC